MLEVALHAHGAKEKPANVDARLVGDECMLDCARPARARDERALAIPSKRGRAAISAPRSEAKAFVFRVGPQVDDAVRSRVQIDLHGVTGGIAKEPRLVSLIGGAVIEAPLGEREHRTHTGGRRGELGEQREGEENHRWCG